jgi:hypothetical protein
MDTLGSSFTRRVADRGIKNWIIAHKKGLGIAAAVFLVFYWFELRPVKINRVCTATAGVSARALLQEKANVATDAATKRSYEQLVSKNMYLRTDYESYYKKCLREDGVFI